MQITFSPFRSNRVLTLERAGDTLIVNGEAFNFAPLPEGGKLPREAIENMWFVGPVERIGGVLHMTLMLPFGADAPEAARFPEPITVIEDGPIVLPGQEDTA